MAGKHERAQVSGRDQQPASGGQRVISLRVMFAMLFRTKTGSVAARSLAGKAMLDGMLPVMYLGYAELSCAFAVWCPVLIEGTRVSGETNRTVRSCTASLGAG